MVIHEIVGVKFRVKSDDSSYSLSREVVRILELHTVKSAAFAIARARNSTASMMKILPERTKIISTRYNGLENITTTEVAIQTFERTSGKSVQVYSVEIGDFQGIISVEVDHFEGDAGAYFWIK